MSASSTAYKDLETLFERLATLGEAMSVLHWDGAVMMPKGGATARGEQLSTLSVYMHEFLTANSTEALLDAAEQAPPEDAWENANLREMRRRWRRAASLPPDLVAAHSKACSECEHIWRDAKTENDFARVKPFLDTVLSLTRERAGILGEALSLSPYDALLDAYEPGARSERIATIFSEYESFLPDFLAAVLEKQAQTGPKPHLTGPFDIATQRRLTHDLAEVAGFDFDAGRIDESAHPFSTGYSGDQRITVSYDSDDPTSAIMAVLHEAGHAMYERQLPKRWARQPVGSARGMALHESQSLFVEMQTSRSPAFLRNLAPRLRAAFGDQQGLADTEVERLFHWVQPDFIRVEADEVTYPAHVILRFNLERALLADDLPLSELPAAWNEGMQRLLDVTPPTDRLGCLQDIHWYDGAIGYFPTYTLGAMAAAQIFQAAEVAIPTLRAQIESADLAPVQQWLAENIHAQASRFTTDEVLTQATGRPLDPSAFQAHLKARYLTDKA